MTKIYAGSTVRLRATFTNPLTGAAVSPSTVKLRVTPPGGTETDISGTIVTEGTGNYRADYTVASAGRLAYRWSSEGAGEVTYGPPGSVTVYAL